MSLEAALKPRAAREGATQGRAGGAEEAPATDTEAAEAPTEVEGKARGHTRNTSGGTCVLDVSACCWSSRSFAAVVRGPDGRESDGHDGARPSSRAGDEGADENSTPSGKPQLVGASSGDSSGRREKLLSPDRK